MKTYTKYFIALTIILILDSCVVSQYTTTPYGDLAKIKLKNNDSFEARIVMITDTSIIFMKDPNSVIYNSSLSNVLFYVLKTDISYLKVSGYNTDDWILHVVLFQALPAVILVAVGTSEMDYQPNLLIFTLPAVFTTLAFLSSEDLTPMWDDSKNISDLDSLKIYSNYPASLNEQELTLLAKKSFQTKIRRYGGSINEKSK